MWGAPMTAVLIWWVVDAHKWFKGPKVNIEHQMLGRYGNLIDGKEDNGGSSGAPSFTREAGDQKAANLA